ncbi:RecX family transcriptional regulator [Agrobacterium tumefaciens]|jgi:regulatory protein|nr:recombination regulator RecX [Agrobacterium fabrum]KEY56298.1 RecX family transcriptional regulator [Agrobacterium tumefaciens]MCX2877788.1 recombination regulator RecX [Agrobacterium fabrum]NMV72702.1 recombination regulator RecX [Agrobacterium fabrum]QQN08116.1 recombination regulator RecX [Agrobacterium fabrum]QQN13181.1 recombination regulator RecX [Agrobacterium fabrum]
MSDDSSPFLTDDMEFDGEAQAVEPTSRMLSWARNSALYRLQQRMMTEKQLRDAIMRKAREKFEDIGPAQVKALGEFAVTFAYGIKALDDTAYAEITVRSGQRSGKSKRGLAQKLQIKGVARETATAALQETNDLVAAVIFARKRAFGPYRRVEPDEKRKAKEFSAFARNGFSFEIGAKVMAMTTEEAEDILSDAPL